MKLPTFNLPRVRDYLTERNFRIKVEQKVYQQAVSEDTTPDDFYIDSDVKRIFRSSRNYKHEIATQRAANAVLSRETQILVDHNYDAHEPFEFYQPRTEPPPPNREPASGITFVPNQYHYGRTIKATETTPETGFTTHPELLKLIESNYPQYRSILDKYCRPLGTTDATFSDFNREQVPSDPVNPDRMQRILKHIKAKLGCKPYLPLHYVDTMFAKLPTSTATAYHNRHSYRMRAYAKYSHSEEYENKPTSKGYFFNAFHEYSRYIIHLIKETGYPFEFTFKDPDSQLEQNLFISKINKFFDTYPTLLFTRTHISEILGTLKQRPVYAVDELFLTIETMLFFPLLVQARLPSCCIMYGLETIRGGNAYLDTLAQYFRSYFTIDWSHFDQSVPRIVTNSFFQEFVPSLLVVNNCYQPTYEYPTYPDLTTESLFKKMMNLLSFIHLWFNNMTFLSQDGFSYRRNYAGVPSGQLITQYIDSYSNLFVLLDALIEFGCSDTEIDKMVLFIMGDDNTGLTDWPITRLEKFIVHLTDYAQNRYNMTISINKSLVTTLRNKIETLGYTCNFGKPTRPISKLVAQLCLPERSVKTRFTSVRAIGLAYAACGSDPIFHNFCKDVHAQFLKYQDEELNLDDLKKFLPSGLALSDDTLLNLNFKEFPSIQEIQKLVWTYQGPLSFAPKWNYSHFKQDPDYTPPNSITMRDYMLQHNITYPSPTILL